MKRALILLLLLAACSKARSDQGDAPTALVTTAVVASASLAQTATAFGAAEFAPGAERALAAPVESSVAAILAPAGTAVRAGEAVIQLRSSPATELELHKARADAAAATAAYARAQRLRIAGLDSDAEVETARAAAASANDAATSLSARTGGALMLRSPIAGVVESVALAPGDLAAAGANVAKVGALNALRVRLGLEPKDAAAVRAGAQVRLSALQGGPELVATVNAVDPRLDAQTRLASVIALAPPGGGLAPGEPVKGVIVLRQDPAGAVIPRAALLYDRDQPYVFVDANAVAHRRPVALGAVDGDRVEVLRGLALGERVIVEGASAVDDGMAVREAKPAGAGS
jgi:RND family efflux transporter MFP subunit